MWKRSILELQETNRIIFWSTAAQLQKTSFSQMQLIVKSNESVIDTIPNQSNLKNSDVVKKI